MQTELLAQVASLWDQFLRGFEFFLFFMRFSPFWGPPILLVIFWYVWIRYVRSNFINSQEYVLLEIKLPQEVQKSPAAMQAVFDGLFNKGGESTFIDRLWYGKVRIWYSFELVSIEGQVHMYVWVRAGFKKWVERVFYAHYPDAELVESEDYSVTLPYSLDTYDSFGGDFKLASSIGVPIRTYTEYGLDQTSAKEDQKVDPINHIFEFLGSMGKGEHLWIQILARANKKEDVTFGFIRNTKDYKAYVADEIASIRNSPEQTVVFPDGGVGKSLSDEQIKKIQAMNRTGMHSTHWDVGIRGIYIAEKNNFDGTNIPGLMNMWSPFGSPGYNTIVPEGSRWQPMFDYPWQDFNDIRVNKKKVRIIDAYRRRSWFHPPYEFKNFMMTSEELATLFHLPGSVAKTPTLQRIGSSRAEAPMNLPR